MRNPAHPRLGQRESAGGDRLHDSGPRCRPGGRQGPRLSIPGRIAQKTPVRTGLAIGLVGQAVSLPLQVVNNVLVIRMLGTQVGLFFLFTTTTMLLSLVLDPLGLKWAATYLIGRKAGRGRSILRASLLVCMASG